VCVHRLSKTPHRNPSLSHALDYPSLNQSRILFTVKGQVNRVDPIKIPRAGFRCRLMKSGHIYLVYIKHSPMDLSLATRDTDAGELGFG